MATKKKAAAKKAKAPKKTAAAAKPAAAETAAPAAKGLYAEISKATKVEAKAKETLQDYAVRACEVISAMTDADFGTLSESAQRWFDGTVEKINGEKMDEIPTLSGFPTSAKEAKAETAAAPAAAKPAKAKGNKKTATKKAAAAPKKTSKGKKGTTGTLPGVAKGGKARVDGLAHQIRTTVVKNPTITFEKCCEKVGTKPKTGGYAFFRWAEAVQVMKVVQANA